MSPGEDSTSLLKAELCITWDRGYEPAAQAASKAFGLSAQICRRWEGPELHFGALPPTARSSGAGSQGYLVEVEKGSDGPLLRCLSRTPQGAFYALRRLQIAEEPQTLVVPAEMRGIDSPGFAHRGIAEAVPTGWSWHTRRELLRFAARHQYDHYIYAPEDDFFRNARWREPYPEELSAQISCFMSYARELFVSVVFLLQPDLDPDSGRDMQLLETKCQWAMEAGAAGVALDLDGQAQDPAVLSQLASRLLTDLRRTWPHANVWADLSIRGPGGHRPDGPGDWPGTDLDPRVRLLWSGPSLVNSRVTADEISELLPESGQTLWLWDNYPDNRIAPQRLFLGPYQGRDPGLSKLVSGVFVVPMQQALASEIPLATAAEFLWDPDGYDPEEAWERALREVGGKTHAALRQFAGLNRSSILNHREDEELETALAAWELEGFHGYLARTLLELEDALGSLGPLGDNQPLMRELAPWLKKASFLVETASSALHLSHSLRTTREDAKTLYGQAVLGLGRSRELPQVIAPMRLDRFAVRAVRQAEIKMGKPLGRIQTTAPRGREHPWGLAADGDLMTSFRATADLEPGHSVTLDMGSVMEARWVHLSQGYFYYWTSGCVEQGRLVSSTDAVTWELLTRIDRPGCWEIDLYLDPMRPIRYLRLVNDAPRPWPMVVRQLEVYE